MLLFLFLFFLYIYIYTHTRNTYWNILKKWLLDETKLLHTFWFNEQLCSSPSISVHSTGGTKNGRKQRAASVISGRSYIWVKEKGQFIIFISFWDEWERKRIEWNMWKIIFKKSQGVPSWTKSSKKNMKNVVNGYREMVRSESSGHP